MIKEIISNIFKKNESFLANELKGKDHLQIGKPIEKATPINNSPVDFFDELPVWLSKESGWGYNQNDAIVILSNNDAEGIHNEYVFAEVRSKIEVEKGLNMHFVGFERNSQRLLNKGDKHYDIINFNVYLFTDEDWNYLKDDYESHNNYENDQDGLTQHNQMRNERIRYYNSECWIDISNFFGKSLF